MTTDPRPWLAAHRPDLLAEFDRYQQAGGPLRLDGWLLCKHEPVYGQWRGTRVEVVVSRGQEVRDA